MTPIEQIKQPLATIALALASANARLETLRDLTTWHPISNAPIALEGNFLVRRQPEGGHGDWIEEVFAFEGNMYPQRCIDGVCWDDRVTDATHWIPLVPNGE